MPSAVVARWGRCWSPDSYPGRPWWRASRWPGVEYGGGGNWYRYDGARSADPVAVDAASPLPRPPMMAGQTWAWGEVETVFLGYYHPRAGIDVPAEAVLVLGPTPWGLDCPWGG